MFNSMPFKLFPAKAIEYCRVVDNTALPFPLDAPIKTVDTGLKLETVAALLPSTPFLKAYFLLDVVPNRLA